MLHMSCEAVYEGTTQGDPTSMGAESLGILSKSI